jgi:hypothetical protein
MRPILTQSTAMAAALLAFAAASIASGDDHPPHRSGHHPAVIVQRLHKAAGYDYASKFYPHPAWLHLYAEPPNDLRETTPVAGADPVGDPHVRHQVIARPRSAGQRLLARGD